MDFLLLVIGLLLLAGLSFVIYKMNNTSLETTLEDKNEELDRMKEILGLEFKNLANEIFDEKTKKISELNKENLSSILNPLRENIERFERKVEISNKDSLEF
jgi:DNA recombination protein RmuC